MRVGTAVLACLACAYESRRVQMQQGMNPNGIVQTRVTSGLSAGGAVVTAAPIVVKAGVTFAADKLPEPQLSAPMYGAPGGRGAPYVPFHGSVVSTRSNTGVAKASKTGKSFGTKFKFTQGIGSKGGTPPTPYAGSPHVRVYAGSPYDAPGRRKAPTMSELSESTDLLASDSSSEVLPTSDVRPATVVVKAGVSVAADQSSEPSLGAPMYAAPGGRGAPYVSPARPVTANTGESKASKTGKSFGTTFKFTKGMGSKGGTPPTPYGGSQAPNLYATTETSDHLAPGQVIDPVDAN
jgi:hypothetical protein|mmetsp:Transcript_43288/g.68522  ORF Transcript_43288/g.68522 Transcript_43288/m.68522 type:complete len:294 (+) Transcript_43288:75-956(+)